MRQVKFKLIFLPCIVVMSLCSAFTDLKSIPETSAQKQPSEEKQAALFVLQNKCNVCHKKQNPFKIFSLKNMDKHAAKIHKQVFELKRMPKGDEISLSESEKNTLKTWLKTVIKIENGTLN